VVAIRQIEMAELMVSANSFSTTYAKCLFAGTPEHQQLAPMQADKTTGFHRKILLASGGNWNHWERTSGFWRRPMGGNVLELDSGGSQ
jgi:hypothetical protein